MNRKTFLARCGAGCVGLLGLPAIMSGCSGTRYVNAPISGDSLVVPLSAFLREGTTNEFVPYIVANNEKLEYPIAVFRAADGRFTALLMRCTHQGTELQVFGDRLQCPAHGSEFTTDGKVQNGPADINLRKFAVDADETSVKIKLS